MERYEIPFTAAYLLLAETSQYKTKRGLLEAFSNLEAAKTIGQNISVVIEPLVARLESKARIATLYPAQARHWLHEHGFTEVKAQ